MTAPPPAMPPPSYYPPPMPYAPPHRPIGVAILAILVILGGVLFLLLGIGILVLSGVAGLGGFPLFGFAGAILGGVLIVFGLIWIGVGLGLWHLRGWAWWLAVIVMILSILGSFASPAGAVVPVLILVYLILVRKHFQ